MKSKSVREMLAEADAEAPVTGVGAAWEANDYELVIVAANYKPAANGFDASIGYQVQRSGDSQKRWFDLRLPDLDSKEGEDRVRAAKTLSASGRKIKSFGLEGHLDAFETAYPGDDVAQYSAVAVAMVGVVFTGTVVKQPKGGQDSVPEADKKMANYINNVVLISGPGAPSVTAAPATGGLGGLGGLSGGPLG